MNMAKLPKMLQDRGPVVNLGVAPYFVEIEESFDFAAERADVVLDGEEAA